MATLTVMQAEGYRDTLRKKMVSEGKSRVAAWVAVNPATVSREEISHALASAVELSGTTGALPVLNNTHAFDGHIFKAIIDALDAFSKSDFGKIVISVLEKLLMGLLIP